MRSKVNVYPAQARAHDDELLSAIGSRPAAGEWYSRRGERRLVRRQRRDRRAGQGLAEPA